MTRHARYNFIDQFRGLTVLFLAISTVTWILGKNDPTLSIPILDHGWQFHDSGLVTWNWLQMQNQMYTVIDLGSSLFMFILGVTVPISFRSRREKYGTGGAIGRMFLRVGVFIGLDALQEAVGGHVTYRAIFFIDTLPALAWGTAIATFAVLLVENPNRRFLIVFALNVLHGTLYLIPDLSPFRHKFPNPVWLGDEVLGGFFDEWIIPWNVISFGSIAIAGTCFWDWFDRARPVESIKKYHLPVATYSIIGCFVVAWFIPFEHHDLTVSQNLLAIASGYYLLVLLFTFEHFFKFKLPLLTPLGRNALFLFIMQLVPGLVMNDILGLYSFVTDQTAWLGLVFCAVSVAFVGVIGVLLHRKRIYLRL